MIIVINQGNPNFVYMGLTESTPPFLAPADFVFPLFLFLVGFLIPLSNVSKSRKSLSIYIKPLFRAIIFLIIGTALNILACNYDFSLLRFPGYLQRIAICYLILVYIYILLHQLVQKAVIFCLMATYLVILYVLNVPSCGQGRLTESCNAVGYIDRQIFGHHMILPTDPQGFFSTFSAISTGYIGLEFGRVYVAYTSRHIYILLIWGFTTVGLLITGILLENWLPWDVTIYSFTYAMVATGFAGSVLFFMYILVQIEWPGSKWIHLALSPLRWLGANPLVIYVLMETLHTVLLYNINVNQEGVWIWIYWNLFAVWIASEEFASLFVSLLWLSFYTAIAFLLYRKKYFLKI